MEVRGFDCFRREGFSSESERRERRRWIGGRKVFDESPQREWEQAPLNQHVFRAFLITEYVDHSVFSQQSLNGLDLCWAS